MLRRLTTSGGLLAAVWLVSTGCGEHTLDADERTACSSDADCTAMERCAPLVPGERPTVAPPCMVTFTYCSTSANCSNGQVCWPLGRNNLVLPPNCYPTGNTCGPPCTSTGATANNACFTDEVCEANGECRLPACDEASGMACPDHWRCDPVAATSEIVQPVYGANEADSPNYGRDITRGCSRLGCDEAGGFTCKDGWVCDPAGATDPSGCVALPCAEAGRCSDDTRFICEPTSSGPRPLGSDAHGCVLKNCEEGFACQRLVNDVNIAYCNFEGLLVDDFGCASHRCDDPGSTCATNQACDPGANFADARGCRPTTCEEGVSCGSLVCDPSSSSADSRGCVTAVGGSGGSGGGSGGSVSGQGGSGAAGRGGQGGRSDGGSGGSTGGSVSGGSSGTGGTASGGSAGTNGSAGSAPREMNGRCVER